MSLIRFFLHHAKINYFLSLFLLLAGIYAYKMLPRELFPPLDANKILISGSYSGASPDNLDKMAVTPLEDEIRGISSITKIESTIRPGAFVIIAEVRRGADRNEALNQVKDGIAKAKGNLPSDMNDPVATALIMKIPLVQVSLASATLSEQELLQKAKLIKNDLASIPHLSDLALYGESDKEVRIRLDSGKIRALGFDPKAISSAMASMSYIFPLGKIESANEGHFYLSTVYGKREPSELLETLLRIGERRVRLREFATIESGYGEGETKSSFNGKRSFNLNISKDEEGDAITLSRVIKERIAVLNKAHPDLLIDTFSDTSVYIKHRLTTVISNITLGFLLVSLAMYWLINKRIAFVVAIGIPFSFLIGALFFDLADYTLNMLSLLGALIALGILVDDAIIVSENIQRHIEEGTDPKEAALNGTKEVVVPVLVASATTIFAFLPMLLMGGEVGQFMKMIPLAVTILILASVIEAFFFLPLHCADLLSKSEPVQDWRGPVAFYQKTLHFLYDRKRLAISLFALIIPILIVVGFATSKYQLFPSFDGSELYVSGRLENGHSIEQTLGFLQELEGEILANKEELFIESTAAIAGFFMNAARESEIAPHNFMIFVELKEAREDNFVERYLTPILSFEWSDGEKVRTLKSQEIEKRLQEKLQRFKERAGVAQLTVSAPGPGLVKHDIEIALLGPDSLLQPALERLTQELEALPGIKSVSNDLKEGNREIKLSINAYGESLGITEGVLGALLSDYFLFSTKAKSLDEDGVIHFRVKDLRKDDLDTLYYFRIQTGTTNVLLKEIAEITQVRAPEKIIKKAGDRQSSVYASVDSSLLTANEALQKIAPTLESLKQQGISVKLGGEREQNTAFARDIFKASMLALFLIFFTLLIVFNSYLVSLTILSVIPLSLLGVLLGHALLGMNLSMPSIIGALGLAGVVINDGIVMISFLEQADTNHEEEFFDRATKRLRPIMLTSITTFIGLSTLIFFASGQAVMLQPLAVSLGFGLLFGTILNLYYLPLLYAVIKTPRVSRIDRPSPKHHLMALALRAFNKKSL